MRSSNWGEVKGSLIVDRLAKPSAYVETRWETYLSRFLENLTDDTGRAVRIVQQSIILKVEKLLASDELLDNLTRDGEHGKTAVVQLPGLHSFEFLRVSGLKAKRIPADGTGLVTRFELEELARVRRIFPSGGEADVLSKANRTKYQHPELRGELLEVANGRSLYALIEEGIEVLRNDEANGRDHRNAAMSKLRLAVTKNGVLVLAVKEVQGVELSTGGGATGKTEAKFLRGSRLRDL